MKNGNWVPIDATMAKYLPLDRPYTIIEAIYCLQLNYDSGSTVTVAGLAKLWGWKSRGKVSRFLDSIGVEIVYHKSMAKSRNKRGVLVFSKRTYDEHKTDIERTNNGHIRLINNKWLDYETDIKRAYGGHKADIGCSTINHTTDPYSEKEKEGGTDEQPGSDNLVPLSHLNGDDTDQHLQDNSAKGGDGRNPVSVVNGSDGDNGVKPACKDDLNGGFLDDTASARTGLDATRPSLDDGIYHDDNRGSGGNSSSLHSMDGQAPVGDGGTQVDREEVGHGMVGVGDNRRMDAADHGGVSLSDKEVNSDTLGTPEKDENKPKPAKKKAKKPKNGVVLDYSALDPLIDEDVMRQFVEFRRAEKKKPVKTQRTLEGIATAALTCRDVYGYDPNHCLLYAMQAGANGGWQLPKPEYFKNEKISFEAWLNRRNGQKVARCQDDILSPLERKNKENAEIAAKMMEGMFDEEGRFTGLH